MIGILPAAGKAERMHGLPKFLLPIPDGYLLQRHIGMMRKACNSIYIGANQYNRPMLHKYSDEASVYLAEPCDTMSETVLSAKYLGRSNDILFGMPDTYIEDDQCYAKLAKTLDTGADLAVGVFLTSVEQRSKLGMCHITDWGELTGIEDKPESTTLKWAWGALAWKPVFWQYLNHSDPHVGYAIPRAIEAGISICAVALDGGYWDCGTPDEYFDLITHLHTEKV